MRLNDAITRAKRRNFIGLVRKARHCFLLRDEGGLDVQRRALLQADVSPSAATAEETMRFQRDSALARFDAKQAFATFELIARKVADPPIVQGFKGDLRTKRTSKQNRIGIENWRSCHARIPNCFVRFDK